MRACICFALLCFLCHAALSDIGPIPGTLQLRLAFEKSDLVCNCVVKSLAEHDNPIEINKKPGIRRQVSAVVEIREAFKPVHAAGSVITVDYEEDDQMGQRVAGSQIGLIRSEVALLFLQKGPAGDFIFSDPFLGATPLTHFPTVGGESGLAMLQRALIATLQSSEQADVIRALQLIQGMDHIGDEALSAANSLAGSGNPEIAIPALGILLKTKSPESANHLSHYLASYKETAPPLSLISLGSELRQFDNVNSLTAMENLAGSQYVAIRYGAMDAIRRIKSPKSVPFLIKQLDDADGNVQYVALISLAEILSKYEGDFAPGMGPFEQDPGRYLSVWKKWWQSEGRAEYGALKPA
jgi:hypothetical protein